MSIYFFLALYPRLGYSCLFFSPLLTYELFILLFCLKDTSGGTARHLRSGSGKSSFAKTTRKLYLLP